MSGKFQNILETVGNTPVVRINRLAPDGINLFVKIEAFNPLGSVKDRLALGVIEDAERTGEAETRPDRCGSNQRQHWYRVGHGLCTERDIRLSSPWRTVSASSAAS